MLHFADIQDGDELDNRIAAIPNMAPEILREHYGRHQQGTLLILARSPKTPADILQAMVGHDLARVNHVFENKWIGKGLKKTNLPEAIHRKFDENEPSATK